MKTVQVDDDTHRRLAELKRTLALKTKKDTDYNDAIRYLLGQENIKVNNEKDENIMDPRFVVRKVPK